VLTDPWPKSRASSLNIRESGQSRRSGSKYLWIKLLSNREAGRRLGSRSRGNHPLPAVGNPEVPGRSRTGGVAESKVPKRAGRGDIGSHGSPTTTRVTRGDVPPNAGMTDRGRRSGGARGVRGAVDSCVRGGAGVVGRFGLAGVDDWERRGADFLALEPGRRAGRARRKRVLVSWATLALAWPRLTRQKSWRAIEGRGRNHEK